MKIAIKIIDLNKTQTIKLLLEIFSYIFGMLLFNFFSKIKWWENLFEDYNKNNANWFKSNSNKTQIIKILLEIFF